MPTYLEISLVAVLIIAASIWIGSYINIIVVSIITTKTLDDSARVAFFRRLGRAHLAVSVPALLVTCAIGWTLLAQLPWSGDLTRLAIGSVALVVVLGVGVLQARDLTRLRQRHHTESADPNGPATAAADALAATIRRRATAAGIVRGLIGIVTLALTVHVAVLLVDVL